MKNSEDLKREYKRDTGKNAPQTHWFEGLEILDTEEIDRENDDEIDKLIEHADNLNLIIEDNTNLLDYLQWLENKLCE